MGLLVFTAELHFSGIFILELPDRRSRPASARVWFPRTSANHHHVPSITVTEESWLEDNDPRASIDHRTVADAEGRALAVIRLHVDDGAAGEIDLGGIDENVIRANWGGDADVPIGNEQSLTRLLDLRKAGAKAPNPNLQVYGVQLPGGFLHSRYPVRFRSEGKHRQISDGVVLRCTVRDRLEIGTPKNPPILVAPGPSAGAVVRVSISNLPLASQDREFHLGALAQGAAVTREQLRDKLQLEGDLITSPSRPCPNGVFA